MSCSLHKKCWSIFGAHCSQLNLWLYCEPRHKWLKSPPAAIHVKNLIIHNNSKSLCVIIWFSASGNADTEGQDALSDHRRMDGWITGCQMSLYLSLTHVAIWITFDLIQTNYFNLTFCEIDSPVSHTCLSLPISPTVCVYIYIYLPNYSSNFPGHLCCPLWSFFPPCLLACLFFDLGLFLDIFLLELFACSGPTSGCKQELSLLTLKLNLFCTVCVCVSMDFFVMLLFVFLCLYDFLVGWHQKRTSSTGWIKMFSILLF